MAGRGAGAVSPSIKEFVRLPHLKQVVDDIESEVPAVENRECHCKEQSNLSSRPLQESSPDENPGGSQNDALLLLQNEISSRAAHQGSTVCDGSSTINVEFCTKADIKLIKKLHKNIYPMKHKRSLAVIVNNNFEGDSQRKGAKKDVSDMRQLWMEFGCKIIIREDKKASEMIKFLQDIAKGEITDGEKFNYLAVFLMSHGGLEDDGGGEEIVFENDHAQVSVKEIKSYFSNENSRYWIDIPKLFFFQFCRGGKLDIGCRHETMSDNDSSNLAPNSSKQATHCTIHPLICLSRIRRCPDSKLYEIL